MFYNLYQNNIAEWDIRIHENQIHAMLKNVGLSIKFWPETKKTNFYIRNRIAIKLVINKSFITSMETFNNTKSFINHIQIWNCKYYLFIINKSLLKNTRHNTFINIGKLGVFFEYDEKTDSQYHIWASDLKKLIKSYAMKFLKHSQ